MIDYTIIIFINSFLHAITLIVDPQIFEQIDGLLNFLTFLALDRNYFLLILSNFLFEDKKRLLKIL